MCRGSLRKTVAVATLAVCLLLAVPRTAEAWVPQPETRDGVASLEQPRQESAFWESLRLALSSTWAKVSVLIDPNG